MEEQINLLHMISISFPTFYTLFTTKTVFRFTYQTVPSTTNSARNFSQDEIKLPNLSQLFSYDKQKRRRKCNLNRIDLHLSLTMYYWEMRAPRFLFLLYPRIYRRSWKLRMDQFSSIFCLRCHNHHHQCRFGIAFAIVRCLIGTELCADVALEIMRK